MKVPIWFVKLIIILESVEECKTIIMNGLIIFVMSQNGNIHIIGLESSFLLNKMFRYLNYRRVFWTISLCMETFIGHLSQHLFSILGILAIYLRLHGGECINVFTKGWLHEWSVSIYLLQDDVEDCFAVTCFWIQV